ncbi:hypothetical protein C1I93_27460 [Micromonospora endophytica]|uniref:Uncharacterized protein n=1 Tax=Micromonospora endophytica TaxID=515350 RepID=A0A2W2C254_9ACTN|nr:BON domain-containing protein [Micromonospora endophytica]PZF86804.1 hypothetical protein C1I93_27460 [Micromonospora endophytica]RIW47010.1 BON domain-containing protein [Micromonospora endophytica]BCJ60931.1 hypothetical protein Jiend_43530 [Micromonospora endophytica]
MADISTIDRTDQQIRSAVQAELDTDPRTRPHEIEVAVSRAVVTLTGRVDSYAKRWAAEQAAHRVTPVRAVANDVAVRWVTDADRADPEIAAAVDHALQWQAFVPVEQLDVSVSRGWVTLRGEVEWEYQRRAAAQAVGQLAGVRGVSNGISVRPAVWPAGTERMA